MQATVVGVTLDGLCGVSGTKPGILHVELLACADELRTDTNDLWWHSLCAVRFHSGKFAAISWLIFSSAIGLTL
jgi:hypothetical protein